MKYCPKCKDNKDSKINCQDCGTHLTDGPITEDPNCEKENLSEPVNSEVIIKQPSRLELIWTVITFILLLLFLYAWSSGFPVMIWHWLIAALMLNRIIKTLSKFSNLKKDQIQDEPSKDKECPKCGATNHSANIRCVCGYEF